ncbi:hypothetical protein [Acinetobacter sp. HR7]|uniref:hypothetical protein n=1 Tax=Acinetobacter sp. HR7 TaxID=1509403 RepID=UPI0005376D45|nr:hypothetical protein [Acinetobacter sp. HR7]KGT46404.1 hypothetical protein GW12_25630 [Acinetobacter sp. HR7]
MSKKDLLDEQAYSLVMQDHQLSAAQAKLEQIDRVTNQINIELAQMLSETNQLISQSENLLETLDNDFLEIALSTNEEDFFIIEDDNYLYEEKSDSSPSQYSPISMLETFDFSNDLTWEEYQKALRSFQEQSNIIISDDPFNDLMSTSQKIALQKRIKEEFSLKNAQCDQYDYMIAGTCGLIGGLIDVLFVGIPGQSPLGNLTDEATNQAVRLFAKMNGWKGANEGKDPTDSAIGFLERKFKVNYDQRYGADVENFFKMSTRNHHIKNLAHSPDLSGLFFSLLDQFQNTATFVGIFDVFNEKGTKIGESSKLIRVNTDTFELQGTNLISKIYCGFINWLGHLFSDVAGSSGASTRGSGIPIPFYSLLQFADFGSFGQHRQSFATLAVRVFEAGYDFRHGMTMAIPVLITELLTRFMWSFKQKIYHQKSWFDCIPNANVPELRRMLLVSHGTLCIIDGMDAALKSAGEPIQFLLRTNLIGWTKFSMLALKEVHAVFNEGKLDIEAVDKYLEQEYRNLRLHF